MVVYFQSWLLELCKLLGEKGTDWKCWALTGRRQKSLVVLTRSPGTAGYPGTERVGTGADEEHPVLRSDAGSPGWAHRASGGSQKNESAFGGNLSTMELPHALSLLGILGGEAPTHLLSLPEDLLCENLPCSWGTLQPLIILVIRDGRRRGKPLMFCSPIP